MIELIQSEWYKFFKNRKNRIVFFILISFLLSIVVKDYYRSKDFIQSKVFSLESERVDSNKYLRMMTVMVEAEEGYDIPEAEILNPEEVDFHKEEKAQSIVLAHYYREEKFEDADVEYIMEVENKRNQNLIEGFEKGFIDESVLSAREQAPYELRSSIRKNEYMLRNNILKEVNDYTVNGKNFLVKLSEGNNPLILISILLLFVIDIFGKELVEGSFKLYYTQPYSRRKIYWSKIISSYIFILIIYLLSILVVFIIVSLLFGMGSFSYPEAILNYSDLFTFKSGIYVSDFQVISSLEYILINIGLFSLCLCMLISILSLLSIITQDVSNTLGILIGMIMITYLLQNISLDSSVFRYYYPLSYIHTSKVLQGSINSSLIYGLLVGGIASILSLIIGDYKFNSEDILGGVN